MKKYKLDLYVAQWITREVEAENKEEAEQKGYDLIEKFVEYKSVNPDVMAELILPNSPSP